MAADAPAYGPGATVAVVGLGKIGMPLAAQYASRGLRVLGCDVNARVVEIVNAGRSPILEEPGLAERVAAEVAAGRLSATTDTATAVRQADVVVVIVPVVVDEQGTVDYRMLEAATEAIARGLHRGCLVVYETTLPVGTTRGRLAEQLRRVSGLEAGSDFHLAFSPERVFSGRIFRDLRRYPKVVGGIDDPSSAAAAAFYAAALEFDDDCPRPHVRVVSSAEAAELTKLVETTYRDVNIALANEFARFADRLGVDVIEAIQAANTQPYSHIHQPGVGVGGHCIPVYPQFMLADKEAGDVLSLPRAARQSNDAMPAYAVELLRRELGDLKGRPVLVLGFAYRDDVREDFLSSAKLLVRELQAAGARPLVHDPLYADHELRRHGVEPYDLEHPSPVDAAVLQAYHSAYRGLDYAHLPGCRVVLDGRNVLDRAEVELQGLRFVAVGRAALGERVERLAAAT